MAGRLPLLPSQSAEIDDEDQDIDIESDDDDACSSVGGPAESDKKAHHNALERKRRDHIKESFMSLRDCLPAAKREKNSRAQILKQATDYIQFMTKKNGTIQKDIENMRRQNQALKQEVQIAERNRLSESSNASSVDGIQGARQLQSIKSAVDEQSESSDNSDHDLSKTRHKRLKVA